MTTTAPDPHQRLVALDVFRGLGVVAMLRVMKPRGWGAVYAPLRHATWHGWTPTDLVFPFFVFIVGVAIVLALGKRQAAGVTSSAMRLQVLRRGLILFGIGVFLSAFPLVQDFLAWEWKDFSRLRIPGVLQRIAVCYVVVALLFLHCRRRTLALITVALLLLYWILMELVPVPGHGAGMLDSKDGNLAAWLDRQVFGDHVWAAARTWDPEGFLSTLPAVATTLFGAFAGMWIRETRPHHRKALQLLVCGTSLVILGYLWDLALPINKSLWTSSFAVFTAGQAMCGLGLCIWLIDIRGHHRLAAPFVVYGVNALTVFVLSGLLGRLLGAIRWVDDGGEIVTLKAAIFATLFQSWISDARAASLGFALSWVAGWFVILWWMHRHRWIFRV